MKTALTTLIFIMFTGSAWAADSFICNVDQVFWYAPESNEIKISPARSWNVSVDKNSISIKSSRDLNDIDFRIYRRTAKAIAGYSADPKGYFPADQDTFYLDLETLRATWVFLGETGHTVHTGLCRTIR